MSTITKEFAQDIINGHGYGVEPSAVEALARSHWPQWTESRWLGSTRSTYMSADWATYGGKNWIANFRGLSAGL